MEKNTSLAIILSSIIIGGSLVYGTTKLSNSIDNAGGNITNSNFQMADSINGNRLNENFELVVNDGWLYLYDTTNGEIWKKVDDPDGSWVNVEHFSK